MNYANLIKYCLFLLVTSICLDTVIAQENQVVTATEFAFEPDTISVQSGEEVTLILRNNGTVGHNLAVPILEVQSATIQPNGEVLVGFTAPAEPGNYRIICTMPGHEEAGMVATLNVK